MPGPNMSFPVNPDMFVAAYGRALSQGAQQAGQTAKTIIGIAQQMKAESDAAKAQEAAVAAGQKYSEWQNKYTQENQGANALPNSSTGTPGAHKLALQKRQEYFDATVRELGLGGEALRLFKRHWEQGNLATSDTMSNFEQVQARKFSVNQAAATTNKAVLDLAGDTTPEAQAIHAQDLDNAIMVEGVLAGEPLEQVEMRRAAKWDAALETGVQTSLQAKDLDGAKALVDLAASRGVPEAVLTSARKRIETYDQSQGGVDAGDKAFAFHLNLVRDPMTGEMGDPQKVEKVVNASLAYVGKTLTGPKQNQAEAQIRERGRALHQSAVEKAQGVVRQFAHDFADKSKSEQNAFIAVQPAYLQSAMTEVAAKLQALPTAETPEGIASLPKIETAVLLQQPVPGDEALGPLTSERAVVAACHKYGLTATQSNQVMKVFAHRDKEKMDRVLDSLHTFFKSQGLDTGDKALGEWIADNPTFIPKVLEMWKEGTSPYASIVAVHTAGVGKSGDYSTAPVGLPDPASVEILDTVKGRITRGVKPLADSVMDAGLRRRAQVVEQKQNDDAARVLSRVAGTEESGTDWEAWGKKKGYLPNEDEDWIRWGKKKGYLPDDTKENR